MLSSSSPEPLPKNGPSPKDGPSASESAPSNGTHNGSHSNGSHSNGTHSNGTHSQNGASSSPSENDARSSLALFEGDPREDDDTSKDGRGGALDVADDASIREFYAQLVSLLTHENAAPPPKPPARGTVRFALKRRALPALLVAALAFVGLSSLLKPRQILWTATTELLLPPKAGGAPDPFAPPETNYDTAAQIALIGSDAITADAFSRLKPATRLAGWGTKELFAPPVSVSSESPDGNGSLVGLSVSSLNPRASFDLIDQVVLAYQRSVVARSTQSRTANLKRANARVASLAVQLDRARRARANFKTRSGVGDANLAQNTVASNIEQLQSQLDAAIRDAPGAATGDATLTSLQERLRAAQTALQEVLRSYLPDAEQARTAQAAVVQSQNAVNARFNQIESQASGRIRQLENALRREQGRLRTLPTIERQQISLNERVTNLESAHRAATERLNQLNIARDAVAIPATTLHDPTVGSSQAIQKARALFVALLGALGLGLVTAMLLDRLDRSVRATPDPEALWNAPVLGALPASGESDSFFRATPSSQKGNPRAKTQTIEACYLAQSHILNLAGSAGARSILFSSALEDEGKATTAANIAVAIAYGGRETLLIDADFWNPTQHKNFDVTLAPGYAQVLRDGLPLSEAIRPTRVNNLYILTPGQEASEGMGNVLNPLSGPPHLKNMALLKKYFDVIVVDGPATVSLADAQLLAHLADAVVLVSAESTPRSEVQRARSMLRLSGAFLLGVVLSRVRSSEVADWNAQVTPETAGR